MYVDLILNLALLVAISVVSGFIAQRWTRSSVVGGIMQGLLFGTAAVVGMLRPVVHGPGIIFDGRSVVVSLCALYFGPVAGAISASIAIAARLVIGGDGATTGILVILASAAIGTVAHRLRGGVVPGPKSLYLFGLVVHIVMVGILLITLPAGTADFVLQQIALPVLLTYPIAAMLAGQILSDQETSARSVAALRRARERLQRAVHAGNVGLWEWDLATDRVYFSPEWKAQIGYEDHEIPHDFAEWEKRVHPDDRARAVHAARELAAGHDARMEQQFRLLHKDGSYRHILARGSKVVDDGERGVTLIGSHVDITAQIDLQGQLLQSQKMETLGRLAGGVAHDFNNLLTVINGTAELVLDDLPASDPKRADVQQIMDAGDRAVGLTRQLLAFSRKQVLAPVTLDVRALVLRMQEMLRRLLGERVTLHVVSGDSTLWVHADPGQLEQVLMNLTVNARDAMPNGGTLTIGTSAASIDDGSGISPACAPGEYVTVSVTDTGVGMDEGTRARIFEPFFTTKATGQGTGLGLSMVYGIATQSGGAVSVTSAPGRGSCFTIYLPRIPAAQPTTGA